VQLTLFEQRLPKKPYHTDEFATGLALWVLPRGDKLFVAYMDVGKGREQDAEALLGFYLFLHGCKSLK